MNVSEIMSAAVVSVGEDEPIVAAARLMKQHNVGSLPVCDSQGKLRGIVTDWDLVLRCMASETDPAATQVGEVMSRGVVTASPFDKVEQASALMARDQIRRLPVVDNGRLVGMVALADLARRSTCEMEAADALAEISSNIKRR